MKQNETKTDDSQDDEMEDGEREESSNKGDTSEKEETPKEEKKGEGVDVSEEYQQKAHAVTHKASKHEIGHLRSKMHAREDEIRDEEMKAKKKDSPKGEFDMAEAPNMDY